MRETKKHDEEFLNRKFDLSRAKRAKDVPHLARLQAEMARGKTRVTIMLDDDVLDTFRKLAGDGPPGYQTLINQAPREYINGQTMVVSGRSNIRIDEEQLRRVLREELTAHQKQSQRRITAK